MLRNILEHYPWLLHYSLGRDELRYTIVPKLHYMWHIAYLSRYLNPRFCWAYPFEDFMNTLVVAAKANLAGSPMKLIGNKVLDNFYMALDLELRRCNRESS